MYEETIKEETAKLAKEKGFDEECRDLHGIYDDYIGCHHVSNTNKHNDKNQFSAPTQEFLAKWLRETHGIEAFVKPFVIPQLNRKGSINYYGLVMIVDCIGDCNASTECKDKYEDAFEDALKLALKLIDIPKPKLSEKEKFVISLRENIKNAKNDEQKQYYIAMAKELFVDFNEFLETCK
ncbi:MAG: hypothetical protein WC428_02675 [Candidatus Paceibacterota bacterium]|jgi:hypothetical protein